MSAEHGLPYPGVFNAGTALCLVNAMILPVDECGGPPAAASATKTVPHAPFSDQRLRRL
jgi:hypothetical protein